MHNSLIFTLSQTKHYKIIIAELIIMWKQACFSDTTPVIVWVVITLLLSLNITSALIFLFKLKPYLRKYIWIQNNSSRAGKQTLS